MKKIDFETHFVTQAWADALFANKECPHFERDPQSNQLRLVYHPGAREPWGDPLLAKLLDLDDMRIKVMDENGIDVQVMSLTAPGVEQFEPALAVKLARGANDELASAMERHPGRYEGYAALAVKHTDEAVKELERAVKDLGFKGWKTHCNYGDSYLDEKRYWPILAKCEELDVPVYLHPTVPKIPEFWTYGIALSGPPFGFGTETALVMVRLILAGVFDEFPRLKIVLGHYAEGLPFLMHRIDWAYTRPHVRSDTTALMPLNKKPSQYLRDNMLVSTSGNYLPAAFFMTKEVLGMDRILLGTDYPYDDPAECLGFLGSLKLSDDDEAALYGGNAEQVGVS
jgi:predicted TIM-barrel fold metal-dependent hydrolase